jgi:N-methylhydantoinase A/oxoprolinase/acetone carboxylase beta subunit
LVDNDVLLRFLAQHGPTPPSILAERTGVGGIILEKRLERLMFLQQVVLAGFTPTDALHVQRLLEIGNSGASLGGAAVFAGRMGLTTEELCRRVVTETERAIENIVLTYLSRSIWQDGQGTPFLNRRDNDLFTVHFVLKLPIIGIGAAARCFLPAVAKRLGTTVFFPDHCEVGNAIGAALIGLDDE